MKKNILILSLLSFSIPSVNAMQIDSLFSFVNKEGIGTFEIKNSKDYKQFINVLISEVDLVNGELVKRDYSRENIKDWTLMAKPAKAIVRPSLTREFQLHYKPKPTTDKTKDKLFQISFLPVPYLEEGEEQKNVMQFAIGFAPYLLVPADKDKALNYIVDRKDKTIEIENKGGTYIRAEFNSCEKNATLTDACYQTVNVLAGRKLSIPLNKEMAAEKNINVNVSTHHYLFKDEHNLKVGSSAKS